MRIPASGPRTAPSLVTCAIEIGLFHSKSFTFNRISLTTVSLRRGTQGILDASIDYLRCETVSTDLAEVAVPGPAAKILEYFFTQMTPRRRKGSPALPRLRLLRRRAKLPFSRQPPSREALRPRPNPPSRCCRFQPECTEIPPVCPLHCQPNAAGCSASPVVFLDAKPEGRLTGILHCV